MTEDDHNAFVDYYKLLGVEPAADVKDIRTQYVRLAKANHPDKGGSTDMMQSLNKAYRTLADSTSRAAYDMVHSFHTGRAGLPTYQYSEAPAVSNRQQSDDYIDLFIDQVYQEYSNSKKQAPSVFSKLFGR